jgi:hypothetical protein
MESVAIYIGCTKNTVQCVRAHTLFAKWLIAFRVNYLDALKVDSVHHGALKKLDGGVVPLQQTFQLQVGFLPAMGTNQTQHIDQ